jgi:hypothetical protein
LGTDEGVGIERLTAQPGGAYGDHKRYDLRDYLDLPKDSGKDEIDIEGLDVCDNYLWMVGSHSRKRCNPEERKSASKNLERLGEISRDANRYLLARIPVVAAGGGVYDLAKSAPDPKNPGKKLAAAQLPCTNEGSALLDALRGDPLIRPFTKIPSKDNGLDVEGLAATESRIFVGLRGPVLRGWAIVLELKLKHAGKGSLELKRIGPDDRPYLRHFLDLDGLGVRDLAIDGDDLLVLAGPTMDLDGPVAVFRWRGGVNHNAGRRKDSMVWRKDLERILEAPFGQGVDHAEGMNVLSSRRGGTTMLMVYDSPGAERKRGVFGVTADLFVIPM